MKYVVVAQAGDIFIQCHRCWAEDNQPNQNFSEYENSLDAYLAACSLACELVSGLWWPQRHCKHFDALSGRLFTQVMRKGHTRYLLVPKEAGLVATEGWQDQGLVYGYPVDHYLLRQTTGAYGWIE